MAVSPRSEDEIRVHVNQWHENPARLRCNSNQQNSEIYLVYPIPTTHPVNQACPSAEICPGSDFPTDIENLYVTDEHNASQQLFSASETISPEEEAGVEGAGEDEVCPQESIGSEMHARLRRDAGFQCTVHSFHYNVPLLTNDSESREEETSGPRFLRAFSYKMGSTHVSRFRQSKKNGHDCRTSANHSILFRRLEYAGRDISSLFGTLASRSLEQLPNYLDSARIERNRARMKLQAESCCVLTGKSSNLYKTVVGTPSISRYPSGS